MLDLHEFDSRIARIGAVLKEKNWMFGTAESCTGGLIAGALTNVSGSSEWFQGGVVSYSNAVKQSLLQVPEDTLIAHGAVSEQTAAAMAQGAQRCLNVQVAVAVSGVAGPTGGTDEKPVGMVCFAWAVGDDVQTDTFYFEGDRDAVRFQTVGASLAVLEKLLTK